MNVNATVLRIKKAMRKQQSILKVFVTMQARLIRINEQLCTEVANLDAEIAELEKSRGLTEQLIQENCTVINNLGKLTGVQSDDE